MEKLEHIKVAEVVGSTPTLFTFISLVNYGIALGSVLTIVGQIQAARS